MTLIELEQLLLENLHATEVHAQGQDAHFTVFVVSDELSQLSRVKQQQAIYAPLLSHFESGEIHALSIRCFDQQKWQRERVLNGF